MLFADFGSEWTKWTRKMEEAEEEEEEEEDEGKGERNQNVFFQRGALKELKRK